MLPRLSASLLVLAAAGCTTAMAPQSASTADDKGEAGQATRVCRDMSTTGSYGPRRVCHTEAEWKKIDALG